jgi:hypothetical protein
MDRGSVSLEGSGPVSKEAASSNLLVAGFLYMITLALSVACYWKGKQQQREVEFDPDMIRLGREESRQRLL